MYKKTLHNIIIYGILSILPKIINYLFLKIFTIKFHPTEYSLYTDMYAISLIIISFITLGLENSYLRFIYKKKYKIHQVFSTVMITLFISVILLLIIMIIFFNKIIYIFNYENHPEYFIIFFIIIFCDVISIIPLISLRIYNMYIKYLIIRMLNILIHCFIIFNIFNIKKNFLYYLIIYPLSFITKYTNEIGYIFYSNAISSIITLLCLFPFLLKINIKNFDFKLSIKMLNYGIPIMLCSISFAINENLDKIIIKRLLSDYLNGSYSACYRIANFMNLYILAFRMSVEPYFFKIYKNIHVKKIYAELIYIFIILGLIIYVFIVSNLKLISELMIDKKYHNSLYIIPIILIANFFLGIYNNISITYKIQDKPIIGTYISLIGVSITIFFNLLLLIPGMKYIICAWGTLVSYFIMLILAYLWGQKNYPIIYPKKKIIFYIIISFIISFILFNINRTFNIIGQLLYIIFILCLEKKLILKILKI